MVVVALQKWRLVGREKKRWGKGKLTLICPPVCSAISVELGPVVGIFRLGRPVA